MSASLDGTIRVWNIQNFTHLYTFELENSPTFSKLFKNSQMLVWGNDQNVQMAQINMIL